MLDRGNIVIVNYPAKSKVEQQQSNIDSVITSNQYANKVYVVKTEEKNGSDHSIIGGKSRYLLGLITRCKNMKNYKTENIDKIELLRNLIAKEVKVERICSGMMRTDNKI